MSKFIIFFNLSIFLGLRKLRDNVCSQSGIPTPLDTTSRTSRTLSTSMLNVSTDSLGPTSPPSKRSKKERYLNSSNGTATVTTSINTSMDFKRPLEYIKRLLSSPNISTQLKTQHSVYLNKFCEVS